MQHKQTSLRQVLEEIKTEEEVRRVCSGFGDANASDYGPTPSDAGNVYGPGAGLAAAAAARAGSAGASLPSQGASGNTAAQIAAQITAQVGYP